jgi:hypothetical protein
LGGTVFGSDIVSLTPMKTGAARSQLPDGPESITSAGFEICLLFSIQRTRACKLVTFDHFVGEQRCILKQ